MNIALILSGGTGTRLGSAIPKQYIKVDDRMIISYCLERFAKHDMIDRIHIVADKMWHNAIYNCFASDICGFSEPGKNRQLSIYNGLTDILKYADENDNVIIHDAARPLVSDETITECLEALNTYDGALPVLPMKDTVYISNDGQRVSSLLDRSKLFAGQAPEAFKLGKYYEASRRLLPDKILKINGSTEPAIMYGMNVALIEGDENNFKITTKADLERFEEIIKDESMDITK